MFAGPEHEPYRRLCEELRLPWTLQHGDWFWWPPLPWADDDESGRRSGIYLLDVNVDQWHGGWVGGGQGRIVGFPEDAVWLPRSDQLDDMLEEAGVSAVLVWRAKLPPPAEQDDRADPFWERQPDVFWAMGAPDADQHAAELAGKTTGPVTAATREEAKLRLLLAVREAQRPPTPSTTS